ncbi:d1f29f99-ca83-442f-b59f-37161cc1d279 [Thermothielavioides terrestris]|uniref:D1f29f99-ca83-442f-b59f-37161cc1d279 n=1 Tax=Thermothielavioides terrestris TaxID=2587410 RepID=A0A3S4BFM3_9PEZI|nr:d1f29f99-ca83-442f-b59f-37161cc1d279 [Thermothielavioides terrestris]
MPSERTPLLVRVPVAEPRPRYPHAVLRRFCTVALASTLIWFFIAVAVSMTFFPDGHSHHDPSDRWTWPGCGRRPVSYDQLRQILLNTPSSERAEAWSRYYTAGPHLAGKNYSQALWTRNKWAEFGIHADIVSYDVYINYPADHRLALLERSEHGNGASTSWKVSFEASLTEDILADDPTSGLPDRVPTFHGYSASGNVTGPVVYVNYGTYQDFEDLVKANVTLKDKIAIARYGGIFRGLKVKRAQELGMLGVILYSDPGDDGDITEEKGKKAYPDGPARQPSSVQRGSTQFLSFAPGDPTTPGYPSKPDAPRQPVHTAIPSIPSIPISYTDALPILKALNGHGPKAADLNRYWTRNTGLQYKGVHYNVGPTPDDVVVNLYNQQDYVTTPLWNVIGVINGTIPDEVIIVGNHRDAWVAGGAGDPNSGSAVLNEVVRSFGRALHLGWKPLRTIVFASWDGEEYGLVGSTEWVEEYLPWLNDANVAGTTLRVSAAPLLDNTIHAVTASVPSPNQTVPGQTVYDLWDKRIKTMGSGSDFTAFQDFAGIPSLDIGFDSGPHDPVYHYHSNYDSFHWMEKFGDPGFAYHRTMAQIIGLATAQLADLPVISFRAADYAQALDRYVKQVEDKLDEALSPAREIDISSLNDDGVYFELRGSTRNSSSSSSSAAASAGSPSAESFRHSLKRLHKAVGKLNKRAVALDKRADELDRRLRQHLPWWRWPTKLRLGFQIRQVNTKYKRLERSFLFDEGLDGRPWFKHVVFAPGLWTGYAGAVFPGLVESIDNQDWANAERWVDIIESRIRNAAQRL